MEPQIRFCTSADGTRIAYVAVGEGPPLVMVPGWGMELDREHPDARAFFESLAEGRLLVWYWRRGVDASQREVDDLSLEAQVADIAAVVDQLQLEQFDLFGGGDSTAVCVVYAAQCPERVLRLVLWAPYPCGQDIVRPKAARAFAELVRENWSLARRTMAEINFPSGSAETRRWMSDYLRQSTSPEVAARYVEFLTTFDLRPFLPRVKAPTLVLHRRGDRSVPIAAGRAAAAMIPDARFVGLEGDMSYPYFGDTSYLETLTQFLDEGRTQTSVAQAAPAAGLVTILFTEMEGSRC